eukprot:TRINITY_DN2757_c0_g1_i1.p1 TRINITY_DN2757_c0_g1~~TRINITY_DN2757_c0_g1_i1.p1  ORF type:complete len:104 (+),score=21.80 TRINITY_DN2757_c0_g1_i1:26-313(+)
MIAGDKDKALVVDMDDADQFKPEKPGKAEKHTSGAFVADNDDLFDDIDTDSDVMLTNIQYKDDSTNKWWTHYSSCCFDPICSRKFTNNSHCIFIY